MRLEELLAKMQAVFTPEQVEVLTEFIKFLDQLVKATDFMEVKEAISRLEKSIESLKDVVRELAHNQMELAEAHKRTDEKVAELAEAQRKTEEELKKTQEILQEVLLVQKEMNKKLGGIDLTIGYMLENEAYRNLPNYLEKAFGIKVLERMIRKEIGGKEINLLAEGVQNGRRVLIVGEAKSRLSIGPERAREVFEELEDKIRAVLEEYKDYTPEQVVPVILTHFASRAFLEEAGKQGYIVVQSFEW